jgi:hypothetical protein
MENNYKAKYLKYKQKYLTLKYGGRLVDMVAKKEIIKNGITYKIPIDCNDNNKFNEIGNFCAIENQSYVDQNKFIIFLYLGDQPFENILYYIFYNTKISKNNIYGLITFAEIRENINIININKKNITTDKNNIDVLDFNNNIFKSNRNKDKNIAIIKKIINSIVTKIKKNNLTNCSITIHINSHGSLDSNKFVSITGNNKIDGDFISTHDFIDIIKPLYDTSISIKNISIITDFCYSKLNFSRDLNIFGSNYELKNTIFMSLRPILSEYIILQRFLQSNPNNDTDFTNFLGKSGPIYKTILTKNINILFDNENGLNEIIDRLNIFLKTFEYTIIIQDLINKQKNNPYTNDPYDDIVLSNILINLFEETNGTLTLIKFFNLIYDPINYNKTVDTFNKVFINDQIKSIQSDDYNENMKSIYGPFSSFLWDFYLHEETIEFLKQLIIYSLNKSKIIDRYSQNSQWFSTQLLKDIF